MEVCLITFRSVTPAQRGEGALRNHKIPCTLKRTPTWLHFPFWTLQHPLFFRSSFRSSSYTSCRFRMGKDRFFPPLELFLRLSYCVPVPDWPLQNLAL